MTRYALCLLIAASALLLLGTSAAAESANVCGVLQEFRAPTAVQAGTVVVGSERFAIATNARQDIGPGASSIGATVCLTGTWQPSQTVGRELSDFRLIVQGPASTAPARTSLPSTSTLPSTGTDTNAVLLLALAALVGVGAWTVTRLRS